MHLVDFIKAQLKMCLFFYRNRIFTIYKPTKLENGTFLYWFEEVRQKVKGRFIRQELFVLNNQFVR